MPPWPEWLEWELELSSHLFKRMADRDFNEVELRRMYAAATGVRAELEPGRWVLETRHRRAAWEVVVEPDPTMQVVVVVTAYPVSV